MTLAELNESTGRIEVFCEYRERELVKQLPGSSWDPDGGPAPGAQKRGAWWVPLSWAGCIQLRAVFGAELQIGPRLAAYGRAQRDGRVGPCTELRTADDASDLAEQFPALRPFQRAGVKFMTTAKQALLADEMGLGKTVQAISALESISDDAYPAIIVCPNSMKVTWLKEFARWAPGRRAVALGHDKVQGKRTAKAATPAQTIAKVRDGEADVLIINWESLRLHTRLHHWPAIHLSEREATEKELNEITWRTVVADEAHKAKEPKSQQTRALWWLGRGAEYRFMLTGTPVANNPADIWSLMRFVAPAEFPAKGKFLERYALTSWAWGGLEVIGLKSENRDELFKILDPRFIRRTKAAVLPQLPPKTYAKRYVQMKPKQKKAYDQMRDQMLADLEGGVLITTNPLARLTRLLQFAAAEGELDAEGNLRLGKLDDAGRVDPKSVSCKVDALEELAAELGGEPAVVFAESVQLIRIAEARLRGLGYKVGLVTGDVVGQARQDFVDAFNEGRVQFLLVTLGAGGEGLSLRGSSTAIFLQRSFNMVKNQQAEDRLHGIGRGKSYECEACEGTGSTYTDPPQQCAACGGAGSKNTPLEIIDVITEDTAEARVWEAMFEKQAQLEEVVRDEATLRAWLAKS